MKMNKICTCLVNPWLVCMFDSSFINISGFYLTWFDLIGFTSIIFSFLAFNSSDKQQMRLFGLISTTLFGIAIYFYGGVNGLFVTLISIIIKLLALTYKEDKLIFIKRISPLIALVFFIFFNPEGWVGIFPAISLIFIAIADTQNTAIKMKYWYYGSAICWLIYAIIIESIPAIIYDIVGISTITYAIYKIKINKATLYPS